MATNNQATEHPNATRLRDAFTAFGAGDLDTVRAILTDDCKWTVAGHSPLSGTYRGWDEISAMFGRLLERTGGSFSMNVLSVLADDKHAAAVFDATATVNGVTETHRRALVNDLTPDGKARAVTDLAYDQAASDKHMSG